MTAVSNLNISMGKTQKNNQQGKPTRKSDYWILGILMVAALIHGLIYIYLVPPWEHYDEPNHFEYAWLLTNRRSIPEKGDYDPVLSRQVVESMVENNFYDDRQDLPSLAEGVDVRIGGFPQFDEPPLYYLFVAVPMSFLNDQSVETQLIAGRSVSLVLYLITIFAAWGVTRELTSPASAMRWLVPAVILLWPSLTDIMTALNNDAAAIAVVSLFFWVAVRLVKNGFSFSGLLLLILISAISIFTKGTAMIVIPLVFLTILLSVARGKYGWVVWSGLGIVFLVVLAAVFSYGDAAGWVRSTFQEENTRAAVNNAPIGDHAFQLVLDPDAPAPRKIWIRQALQAPDGRLIGHQTVTLGAWMWASEPVKFSTPVIRTYPGFQVGYQEVELDETPTFVAFSIDLFKGTGRTFISLEQIETVDKYVTIFADGLVLAVGDYEAYGAPEFNSSDGSTLTWGEDSLTNLLNNPSAEDGWPRFRSWVDRIGIMVLPDPGVNTPSVSLSTILDYQISTEYYSTTIQHLGRTFWAKSGWGHVPLLGHKPYRVLAVFTLLGMLGVGLYVIRKNFRLDWAMVVLFMLFIGTAWGMTIIRGANYVMIPYKLYIPVARYVFPAVVPALFVFSGGWWTLLSYPKKWLKLENQLIYLLPVIALLILDIYAIYSIYRFYG